MLDGWRAAEVAPEVQRIAQWAAGSGANLLPVGERFPGELAELAARSTDHSADDSAGQLANKQAQVSGLDKRQRQRQRERERDWSEMRDALCPLGRLFFRLGGVFSQLDCGEHLAPD